MSYDSFQRLTNPSPFYVDDNGNPLVGATLTFYASGGSTFKNTYSHPDLDPSHLNPNPVTSVEGGMFPPIFMEGGDYRVVLNAPPAIDNTPGAVIYDRDPVQGLAFYVDPDLPYDSLDTSVLYPASGGQTSLSNWGKTIAFTIQAATYTLNADNPDGWNVTFKNAYTAAGVPSTVAITPPPTKTIEGSTSAYSFAGAGSARNFICDSNGNYLVRNEVAKIQSGTFTAGSDAGAGSFSVTLPVPDGTLIFMHMGLGTTGALKGYTQVVTSGLVSITMDPVAISADIFYWTAFYI